MVGEAGHAPHKLPQEGGISLSFSVSSLSLRPNQVVCTLDPLSLLFSSLLNVCRSNIQRYRVRVSALSASFYSYHHLALVLLKLKSCDPRSSSLGGDQAFETG